LKDFEGKFLNLDTRASWARWLEPARKNGITTDNIDPKFENLRRGLTLEKEVNSRQYLLGSLLTLLINGASLLPKPAMKT